MMGPNHPDYRRPRMTRGLFFAPARGSCVTTRCCAALLMVIAAVPCPALSPDEVMVIANRDVAGSVELARYYMEKRAVRSILELSLGQLQGSIGRADYNDKVLEPVRKALAEREPTSPIRCLVTVYGVPYKVGPRGPLPDKSVELAQWRQKLQAQQDISAALAAEGRKNTTAFQQSEARVMQYRAEVNRITGAETGASLDSELSLARFEDYDLFRWRPNDLLNNPVPEISRTLMVSRLDGPSLEIVRALVDKALAAETHGLQGVAYVDSRGITRRDPFGQYDASLRELAAMIHRQGLFEVHHESTEALFQDGDCPRTAVYCGWYSLKNYIDAFDFVDGAVGYHIASFEAVDLRDPNSTQWCPAMLRDGITATLGPVAEPYLQAFPKPDMFFSKLFAGRCLVEAFCATNPYNSWQMLLIGDPLYRPFKRP